MKSVASAALLAISLAVSSTAFAQSAAPADPATLSAARDVVARMQGDRAAVLQAMSAPMAGMLAQMGIKEPDRAQVIVSEVIVPTLSAHYDELLDVQARAFAGALSASDLQAVAAFFATPAGRNFSAAQPKLAQAQMNGMTQWMGKLAPELQTKIAEAAQKHGWTGKK
jgi:hypothetical protein